MEPSKGKPSFQGGKNKDGAIFEKYLTPFLDF